MSKQSPEHPELVGAISVLSTDILLALVNAGVEDQPMQLVKRSRELARMHIEYATAVKESLEQSLEAH